MIGPTVRSTCAADVDVVGDLAAPAEPDAALLLQRVQHAGGQAAGGRFAFRDRRHPVGDDDKRTFYLASMEWGSKQVRQQA